VGTDRHRRARAGQITSGDGGSLRSRLALVAALAGAALALSVSAAAAGEPPLSEPPEALDQALDCPETFEAQDREPVLLVQGTGPTPRENFGWNLLPQLRADGFDVCTVELPTRALADIQIAAEYVVHGVRAIHDASGLQVDIAGHSQGGLEPRWAMAWWPSTKELIDDVVTFASPHDGTIAADVACATGPCWPAVHQMRPGSDFLTALWAQEDLAGVDVTSLGSVMDELVQPPETIELPGASNILLQDVCPGRVVTHLSIVADAVAYELTRQAFLADGSADPSELPDDICQRLFIDEASPAFLLDPDTTSGYLEGSFLDPDVVTTLLTTEEPPLADYATADDDASGEEQPADAEQDAETDPEGEQDPDPEGEREPGSDDVAGVAEPAPGDGGASGTSAGDPVTAAAALPATGGSAAVLGSLLLALGMALSGNRVRAVSR
jgi:triacylglycerol lipase